MAGRVKPALLIMEDWKYCVETLPKVSRTFALNISVLKGNIHKSILVAYLFCRAIDTVEDAAKLEGPNKIELLLNFASLLKNTTNREHSLNQWIKKITIVDGSPSDLDLLRNTQKVFNVFESLKDSHKQHIISSVCKMAQGMAYFQKKNNSKQTNLIENAEELEEYCYFVAGVVGEMLCNLFIEEISGLSTQNKKIMRNKAVSFGLGLQITNISKDIVADRERGWSYVPRSYIEANGLSFEEFHAGKSTEEDLKVLQSLLNKTVGHLNDAFDFILAIPKSYMRIRLFCIWPLWMAMKTVAELHKNHNLLKSNANVKISRKTVKQILRRTPFICWSDSLLRRSFKKILKDKEFTELEKFDLNKLKQRLKKLALDDFSQKSQET